jgi:hypothetical protein
MLIDLGVVIDVRDIRVLAMLHGASVGAAHGEGKGPGRPGNLIRIAPIATSVPT